jgi:hypothetical protein
LHARIDALFLHQLGGLANFGDLAMVQHHDAVGVLDGGKPVGNDKGGINFTDNLKKLIENRLSPIKQLKTI